MHVPLTIIANHLLARDAWARKLLQAHQSRVAEVHGLGLSIRFQIGRDGYLADAPHGKAPDLEISVPPEALSAWPDGLAAISRHASIKGNVEFAEAISHVARELRPDPAEDLSQIFGNAVAQRLANGFSTLARVPTNLVKSSWQALAEQSHQPGNPVVDSASLLRFSAEADTLRDDVARLEVRLRRLEGR